MFFHAPKQSPLEQKSLLTEKKIVNYRKYGDTKLQLTLHVKIIVVFHANIRTKWSSIIIHKSRMKWGLKNPIKCDHIASSVVVTML